MTREEPKATFITFYSFKGGVGRSMALINTAGILAGRGFRVLVIDLDLEAPGLSYLDPNAPDASPSEFKRTQQSLQLGFVDLLLDAKERGQEADLFAMPNDALANRYTRAYHIPDDILEFKDGSLHIMPAGRFDGNYAQRFDELNLHALYEQGLGEPLVRAFKKKFAESGRYDYVLVDSRTGFSDEAGICTRDLADHLMILSGLNRQNVEGTREFLKTLRAATDGKKSLQIILSPVPNGEDVLLDQREAAARTAFDRAWASKIDLSLQIPYHPQLALTEEPHIFRRRRGYLFEAYRDIERRMLRALGHDARTLMRKIEDTVQEQAYPRALYDLRHLIRLDGGRRALRRIAYNLIRADSQRTLGVKEEATFDEGRGMLDRIVRGEDGQRLFEFVVANLPSEERGWVTAELINRLKHISADVADRFFERIVRAEPLHADTLGNFAVFLEQERGNMDAAEAYYRQAIEIEPTNARHLANYADFLEKQRGDMDGAEVHYKRAIEAKPTGGANLRNYAGFLARRRGDKDGAEAHYRRAIDAQPTSAANLGSFATFLVDYLGDKDAAECYFKRAIEADPTSAVALGNYALFLVKYRGDKDGAEAYFKRAIEAEPASADYLGRFAVFLAQQRGDKDGAEVYFKRAIEAQPTSADQLGNYAVFLEQERGNMDAAEAYYKRAIEVEPTNAHHLANYADFLEKERGDMDGAEACYKRAIEADPTSAASLADYGQFLLGHARLSEAKETLFAGFEHLDRSHPMQMAKVCFSLWLVSRMLGHDTGRWEQGLKFFIELGFKRPQWGVDGILEQAEKALPTEEFEYATALARAFLDETKVADLERYDRWRALEPVDPKATEQQA